MDETVFTFFLFFLNIFLSLFAIKISYRSCCHLFVFTCTFIIKDIHNIYLKPLSISLPFSFLLLQRWALLVLWVEFSLQMHAGTSWNQLYQVTMQKHHGKSVFHLVFWWSQHKVKNVPFYILTAKFLNWCPDHPLATRRLVHLHR